ncbi:hypothetical protein KKC45_00765 [Patescibacteria group bacterium]|nr:hypothetical protein [Patescibacteria group bacterium]
MNRLYHRRKDPHPERGTNLAKTEVVFGIVIRPDGNILIIQDSPVKGSRRRWSTSDSKYKTPGGKVVKDRRAKDSIQYKIRKETDVSSIHLMAGKPFFVIEVKDHLVVSFYLMGYIQGEPAPNKGIKFANFLPPGEVKKKIEKGEFLENHQLALEKYLRGDFSEDHQDALEKYLGNPTSY